MQAMHSQRSLLFLSFFPLVLLLYSCSTSRQAIPSQIGLLPLDGYRYTYSGSEADTLFRVIREETIFNASFQPNNATVRRPAFNGQTVVVLVTKSIPTAPLHFSRAEVVGKEINVYAQPCTTCDRSAVVAATIPNVSSAHNVRLFINGENKASVKL
jgi:hypothetical protein